jgi:hypothetical protein
MENENKENKTTKIDNSNNKKEIYENIRAIIGDGKLKNAKEFALKIASNEEDKNKVELIYARYEGANSEYFKAKIDYNNYALVVNNCNDSLLELCQKIINKENTTTIIKENSRLKKLLMPILFFSLIGALLTAINIFEQEHTTLLGSGSEYSFLKEKVPNLFNNTSWRNFLYYHIYVSPLECNSKAAKEVIKASYQRNEPLGEKLIGLIGMSSSEIDDLKDDTVNKYYSMQIGEDPLKVTIGLKKQGSLPLNKTNFLDSEYLAKIIKDKDFQIYVTDSGSGTLSGYHYLKNILSKLNTKQFNPYKVSYYDTNATFKSIKEENKNWIILGSQYYTLTEAQRNDIEFKNKFKLEDYGLNISTSPKPLILYFKIDDDHSDKLETFNGAFLYGYEIDRAKSLFLTRFFSELGILENMKSDTTYKLKFLRNKRWGIKEEKTTIFKDIKK